MMQEIRKSGIAREFVLDKGFKWDHSDWLSLLENIRAKGFRDFNPDELGLLLDNERKKLLAKIEYSKKRAARTKHTVKKEDRDIQLRVDDLARAEKLFNEAQIDFAKKQDMRDEKLHHVLSQAEINEAMLREKLEHAKQQTEILRERERTLLAIEKRLFEKESLWDRKINNAKEELGKGFYKLDTEREKLEKKGQYIKLIESGLKKRELDALKLLSMTRDILAKDRELASKEKDAAKLLSCKGFLEKKEDKLQKWHENLHFRELSVKHKLRSIERVQKRQDRIQAELEKEMEMLEKKRIRTR